MSTAKLVLRIVGVLVATAVAAALAFWLTGFWYDHWVLPDILKSSPLDGQAGLEQFFDSAFAAVISALIVFVGGMSWVIRSARKSGQEL
jgi:lysylphosphatidylglycerol synthetase-like protein (DUF2156 family)